MSINNLINNNLNTYEFYFDYGDDTCPLGVAHNIYDTYQQYLFLKQTSEIEQIKYLIMIEYDANGNLIKHYYESDGTLGELFGFNGLESQMEID